MVPVVKSPSSNAGGRCGFNPLSGSYDPTCDGAKNQNIKQKGYCNHFNKGFKKMVHIKKKKKKNMEPEISGKVNFQILKFKRK